MKKTFILIFICLVLVNCTEKENSFDSLDCTIGGAFNEIYSLKLTQSDTLYIHQPWIRGEFNNSISIPKENTNYYGIINQKERLELTNFIEKVDLFKYKSEYYEDYIDGSCYALNIKKGSKSKTIFVHSNTTPKQIDSIVKWINSIKQKLQLKETNKDLKFSASGLVFPPPPPPIK